MKNRLLLGLMALVALTFICCNQQEEVLPSTENTSTTTTTATALLENPDDVGNEATIEACDGAADAAEIPGQKYCVYQIKNFTGGAESCGNLSVGDYVCVNCPEKRARPNADCYGNAPLATPFKLKKNGVVICKGKWNLNLNNCEPCHRNGKKGYKFVD